MLRLSSATPRCFLGLAPHCFLCGRLVLSSASTAFLPLFCSCLLANLCYCFLLEPLCCAPLLSSALFLLSFWSLFPVARFTCVRCLVWVCYLRPWRSSCSSRFPCLRALPSASLFPFRPPLHGFFYCFFFLCFGFLLAYTLVSLSACFFLSWFDSVSLVFLSSAVFFLLCGVFMIAFLCVLSSKKDACCIGRLGLFCFYGAPSFFSVLSARLSFSAFLFTVSVICTCVYWLFWLSVASCLSFVAFLPCVFASLALWLCFASMGLLDFPFRCVLSYLPLVSLSLVLSARSCLVVYPFFVLLCLPVCGVVFSPLSLFALCCWPLL